MISRVLCFALLCCSWGMAFAQAKVYVNATADDPVGVQLVYHLREHVRGANGMTLGFSQEDAAITVHVVTLDPGDGAGAGLQTVYSAVWTVKQLDRRADAFFTSYVGICGRSRARDCATTIAAKTDEVITGMQEALRRILAPKE